MSDNPKIGNLLGPLAYRFQHLLRQAPAIPSLVALSSQTKSMRWRHRGKSAALSSDLESTKRMFGFERRCSHWPRLMSRCFRGSEADHSACTSQRRRPKWGLHPRRVPAGADTTCRANRCYICAIDGRRVREIEDDGRATWVQEFAIDSSDLTIVDTRLSADLAFTNQVFWFAESSDSREEKDGPTFSQQIAQLVSAHFDGCSCAVYAAHSVLTTAMLVVSPVGQLAEMAAARDLPSSSSALRRLYPCPNRDRHSKPVTRVRRRSA